MSELSTLIDQNQLYVWQQVQSDPKWAYLRGLAHDVNDLSTIVNALGWQTLDQATAGCAVLNAYATPIQHPTDLSFTRADLVTEDWITIRSQISAATNAVPHTIFASGYIHTTRADVDYGLVTPAQLNEIADKLPSTSFKFVDETMDCDDFCDVAQGWLASEGLGNAAIGVAYYTAYKGDVVLGAHAALIAVETTGDVVWLEPQNGHIYDLQQSYALRGADLLAITDLFF